MNGRQSVTRRPWGSAPAVWVIVILFAHLGDSQLTAQTVKPEVGRAFMTDVSGPPVTSGDLAAGLFMGQPGTVQTFQCAAAQAVRDASMALQADLQNGRLQVASGNPTVVVAPLETQQTLLELMDSPESEPGPNHPLVLALTPEVNPGPGAESAAGALVRALHGLIASGVEVSPEDPGTRGATHLHVATSRYNEFLNASSRGFLADPPLEFLAVHVALSRLIIAAHDQAHREEPCPAPPSPEPTNPEPAAAPVLEVASLICLLVEGEFRDVPLVVRPVSGDTVAVMEGERVPLERLRDHGDPHAARDWVRSDEPLEFMGSRYLAFGPPRAVSPGELRPLSGGPPGLTLLSAPDTKESPPDEIYLAVGPHCTVQPYQVEEEVRQVSG